MPTPFLLNGILESQKSGHLYTLAGSYDALASVTVPSGGLASVTFAVIPTGYTHLELRGNVRSSSSNGTDGVGLYMRFNGDTAGNYAYHRLLGNGSAASASAASSTSNPEMTTVSASGVTANVYAGFVCTILDYANIYKYKTVRTLGGYDANGAGYIELASDLWQNTAAITSFNIYDGIGTGFAQYSSFALYGVKA